MMAPYFFHALLAVILAFALDGASVPMLMLVFFISHAALRLVAVAFPGTPGFPLRDYLRAMERIYFAAPYLLWELFLANLKVAWEILSPGFGMHTAFVSCGLGNLSPAQRVVVAFAVTLTPGTMSVDFSRDGKTLYIHAMYGKDEEAVREETRRIARRLFGKEP